jgi:hypothetical protein
MTGAAKRWAEWEAACEAAGLPRSASRAFPAGMNTMRIKTSGRSSRAIPAGVLPAFLLLDCHAHQGCVFVTFFQSTIPRRSSASVQALLRSSILARTKISTSNCRNSLSSKAGVLPPLSAGTSVCAPELTVKADTLIRQCHKRPILGDSWACGLRWRAQHLQKYPSGPMFAAQNN